MIKRIISLLILILLLVGCTHQINSTIYVLSVGFERNENGLTTHFLVNPKNDLSRADSNDPKQNVIYSSKEKTIALAFNDIKNSYAADLNFKHIKTFIFQRSSFNDEDINMFLRFIKTSEEVTFNSYIFVTDDKLSDLFDTFNPEGISMQFSFLSSPDSIYYHDYGVDKIHLLDFANNFLDANAYLHVPILKVLDNWNEIKTLTITGFYAYDKKNKKLFPYLYHDYLGMTLLYSRTYLYTDSFRLYDYKVRIINRHHSLEIHLSYDSGSFETLNSKQVEEKIISEINKFLNKYIDDFGYLYLISYYNYLHSTEFAFNSFYVSF